MLMKKKSYVVSIFEILFSILFFEVPSFYRADWPKNYFCVKKGVPCVNAFEIIVLSCKM